MGQRHLEGCWGSSASWQIEHAGSDYYICTKCFEKPAARSFREKLRRRAARSAKGGVNFDDDDWGHEEVLLHPHFSRLRGSGATEGSDQRGYGSHGERDGHVVALPALS